MDQETSVQESPFPQESLFCAAGSFHAFNTAFQASDTYTWDHAVHYVRSIKSTECTLQRSRGLHKVCQNHCFLPLSCSLMKAVHVLPCWVAVFLELCLYCLQNAT